MKVATRGNNFWRGLMQAKGLILCLSVLCAGCKHGAPSHHASIQEVYWGKVTGNLTACLIAISHYTDDTGALPNEDSLFNDLRGHPRVNEWDKYCGRRVIEALNALECESPVVQKPSENMIQIICAGPDGILGTEDDLAGEYIYSPVIPAGHDRWSVHSVRTWTSIMDGRPIFLIPKPEEVKQEQER